MQKSDSIKELAAALSKAQGEFAGAAKDSLNPHFKVKYADLESVVAAIKPHLAKHGLSFVQLSSESSGAAIETLIMHSSGEWISTGVICVPVGKNDAHGMGSALTYARRYSLSSAFGIAPEDDDGNAATKSKPTNNAMPENDVLKHIAAIVAATDRDALTVAYKEACTESSEAKDLASYDKFKTTMLAVAAKITDKGAS